MKKNIIIILSILICFCCKSKNKNEYLTPNVRKAIENPELTRKSEIVAKTKKEKEDSVDEDQTKDIRPKGLTTLQVNKKDIMGVWKGDFDDGPNATFAIYEDSLLNVEHLESYKYELRGDSLIIDFEDWMSVSIITKADDDTLILIDENGKSIYTKFKD